MIDDFNACMQEIKHLSLIECAIGVKYAAKTQRQLHSEVCLASPPEGWRHNFPRGNFLHDNVQRLQRPVTDRSNDVFVQLRPSRAPLRNNSGGLPGTMNAATLLHKSGVSLTSLLSSTRSHSPMLAFWFCRGTRAATMSAIFSTRDK